MSFLHQRLTFFKTFFFLHMVLVYISQRINNTKPDRGVILVRFNQSRRAWMWSSRNLKAPLLSQEASVGNPAKYHWTFKEYWKSEIHVQWLKPKTKSAKRQLIRREFNLYYHIGKKKKKSVNIQHDEHLINKNQNCATDYSLYCMCVDQVSLIGGGFLQDVLRLSV